MYTVGHTLSLPDAFPSSGHGQPVLHGELRMRDGAVLLAGEGIEQGEDQLLRLDVERAAVLRRAHDEIPHQAIAGECLRGVLDQGLVGRDRKSTRLNSVTNAHLVCRLLLEKKNKND